MSERHHQIMLGACVDKRTTARIAERLDQLTNGDHILTHNCVITYDAGEQLCRVLVMVPKERCSDRDRAYAWVCQDIKRACPEWKWATEEKGNPR